MLEDYNSADSMMGLSECESYMLATYRLLIVVIPPLYSLSSAALMDHKAMAHISIIAHTTARAYHPYF